MRNISHLAGSTNTAANAANNVTGPASVLTGPIADAHGDLSSDPSLRRLLVETIRALRARNSAIRHAANAHVESSPHTFGVAGF